MGNNDWAAPAETITEDDFPGGKPDTSGMWPEGNYTGKYLRFECGASMLKATNYIRIFFDVQGRHVESTVWITDANFDYADKQLRVCGWNLQYPDVDFDPPELVPLYMKHGEYKGKPKEEWRISTLGPAKEADSNTMSRFAERSRARLAEKGEAHPPATMPAKAATNPPAKPPARPGAKTPPAPAARRAETQEQAWAAWVSAGCSDGDAFWKAVDVAAPGKTEDKITADEWQAVATAAPPF